MAEELPASAIRNFAISEDCALDLRCYWAVHLDNICSCRDIPLPGQTEVATWSAVRDPDTAHPRGIGVFDVDPGRFPGDNATRTRCDGFGFRARGRTA
jgi:hypothetical protein